MSEDGSRQPRLGGPPQPCTVFVSLATGAKGFSRVGGAALTASPARGRTGTAPGGRRARLQCTAQARTPFQLSSIARHMSVPDRLQRIHAEISQHVRSDLAAQRREPAFSVPLLTDRLARWLRDSRDGPIAELFVNLLLVTAPSAVLVFCCRPSHLVGALHLGITYAVFLERYLVALLHVTEHRQLFLPGACMQ